MPAEPRVALLVGRFQAITRDQAEWISRLANEPISEIVLVITSADHHGTRRNPFDAATRRALVEPELRKTGKPYRICEISDIPESAAWVAHVVANVKAQSSLELRPEATFVYSSNHEVRTLFESGGFQVVASAEIGLTPQEFLSRVIDGRPWKELASGPTAALLADAQVHKRLKTIFAERLLNDDGELGHQRDFKSYGAQMDASLQQKLDDLLPWVRPGLIVDKGCGTGKLLVELSKRFPDSGLVGVDLSREFLRECDENHYASEQVELVAGNAADRQLAPGTATTVIFSSVTHEIYSYSDYSHRELQRAIQNAATELRPGGRVLIRDGISPGPGDVRMRFLKPEVRSQFKKFAAEFKRGEGAPHDWHGEDTVRLSAHLMNEFLCKKDYLKNWHIEINEEFGALSLDGWRALFERVGLRCIEARAYVNEWIRKNRYEGSVALTDDAGRPVEWPATNCVVVGERP